MPNELKVTTSALPANTAKANRDLISTMPTELAAAVKTPREHFFAEDGQSDFRDGFWTMPARLSPALVSQARAVQADPEFWRDAKPQAIRTWLDQLGMVVAGRLSADDVSARIAAIAALMGPVPVRTFTTDTLRKAAETFKFFPSYAELWELLQADCGRVLLARERVKLIAEAGEP